MSSINIKSITKIITINILAVISIFIMIEGVSYLILQQLEKKERSSNNGNKENHSNKDKPSSWNFIFDPAVGTVHKQTDYLSSPNSINSTSNNNLFTYKSYGNQSKKVSLLILGGSTSDALGTQFSGKNGTWPDQFGPMLSNEKKRKVSIINGATGGNNSSQELIRLITLMQYNNPDYVISLNGSNEYYFEDSGVLRDNRNTYVPRMLATALNRSYINIPYKNKNLSSQSWLPNSLSNYHMQLNKLLRKLKLNRRKKEFEIDKFNNKNNQINIVLSKEKIKQLIRAANIWEQNIIYMNAISNSRGAKYFVFLQPTYGLDMTRKDVFNLSSEKEKKAATELLKSNYIERINFLYKIMREKCENIFYCIDLSQNNKLTTNYDLYTDPRHLNSIGNKKLAQEILKSFQDNSTKD